MMLDSLGYKTIPVTHPQEALSIIESCKKEIDLLMTDIIMPEMNGKDLAKIAFKLNPQLKCLFMSGYTDDVISNYQILDDMNFIQKPFSKQELSSKLKKILSKD